MMRRRFITIVLCVMLTGIGCASVKPVQPPESQAAPDYTEQLRGLVQQTMTKANQEQDQLRKDVIKRHPYFFKEYSVYDDPGQPFDVVLHKTESRMRPYLADVKLDKTRYSTRFARRYKDAKADEAFFRDKGQETLTYQWRNKEWKQVGSLFVSEMSEEYVNGEWVPRRVEVKHLYEEEETEGWWVWTWIKKFFHRG